jgi:hypothetical protein
MGCCNEGNVYAEVEEAATTQVPYFKLPQVVHAQYRVNGHPLAALVFTLLTDAPPGSRYAAPVVLSDGSIEYARVDGDPPPDIDGYERCQDNPWKFLPLWPACAVRMQGTRRERSGAIDVVMLCQHPEHERFGKPVKYVGCSACPLRRV